jgi:hypothetical protein
LSIDTVHSISNNILINSNFILLPQLANAQEEQTDESDSKIEDNTGGEKKDGSDEDGSDVGSDNNDENPTDLVDSLDEPTDDVLKSFAPIDSITSPVDPFKTELTDPTNNNESGGSTGGSTAGDNNNNSSSILANNSDIITPATNNNGSKSGLDLSVDIKEDPIVRGNIQTIRVTVSDDDSEEGIDDANVEAIIEYASGKYTKELGSKTTDSSGHASFSWRIGETSNPGTFTATVEASKDGYDSETEKASFEVIPKGSSRNGGHGGSEVDGSNANSVSTEQQSQNKKYFAEYTDNSPNSPVYITGTVMHKTALNDIQIDGEVKNNGTQIVDFVQVITTFYDANNITLGNDMTYTNPSNLQPGQSAPFSVFTGEHIPIEDIKSAKYHLKWE